MELNVSFEEFDKYLLSQHLPIIHQIWFGTFDDKYKSKKIWKNLRPYRESWTINNPNWCHVIWNRKKSVELVQTYYSEYTELFHKYKYEVQRCDMIRYCILHRYGGIYADMDYRCKKPFDQVYDIWNKYDLYFVQTPNSFNNDFCVSNSLMIARVKDHMFWKILLLEMNRVHDSYSIMSKHIEIMLTTGPKVLSKIYSIYRFRYKLGFLPHHLFHPLSLKKLILEPEEEKEVYAIHKVFGGWESTDSKFINFLYIHLKLILFIICILVFPQLLLSLIKQ